MQWHSHILDLSYRWDDRHSEDMIMSKWFCTYNIVAWMTPVHTSE